jgi:histidinol-phosphate/aromatic aminotransferase/cobyric acid decarboxylase-like protein
MEDCRIIAVTSSDWAQEVTRDWQVCGLRPCREDHAHLWPPDPEQASPSALEYLAHLLREVHKLGVPVLLVTDSPRLWKLAAGIVEVAVDCVWALVLLDADAGTATASNTARALLNSRSRLRPGTSYSLSRACVSLADEVMHPGAVVAHLGAQREFAERREGTLVVNGDNWRHAQGHGLYPSVASLAALEEMIGQQDGSERGHVVVVPGGIAAAFELVCTAFSLAGGNAILVGPAYYGIERAMAVRAISPRIVDAERSEPGQLAGTVRAQLDAATRMVLLTHPSLYACDCMAGALVELSAGLPPYCLLVVDECYRAYVPDGARCSVEQLSLTVSSPTVVGLRGFSKAHGLAGLRLAYAVSDKRTARRLRVAGGLKPCAEPVVQEALQHLRARPVATAVREDVQRRDALVRRLRGAGILARGAGPYVLVPSRTAKAFAQRARRLELAGIRISLETCPIVVYQPATDAWDVRFCEAVVAAGVPS